MKELEKLVQEILEKKGYENLNPMIEESIGMDENEINDFLCSEGINSSVESGNYLVHSGQLNDQLLFILVTEDNPSYKPICLKLDDLVNYNTIFIKLFI